MEEIITLEPMLQEEVLTQEITSMLLTPQDAVRQELLQNTTQHEEVVLQMEIHKQRPEGVIIPIEHLLKQV
ncbi:hypothetical protein C1A40_01490 [Tamlana carrageenivorans]|uniref:Uncharacterized protein n=1 Tax=Pseudotamlana carrageenivorans TaxID=2069432 RepID=A0A2I7SEA5_9FLAO|nr:hypothetical protein C1A40_01490 [Tamlana carrageenivorans]